MEQSIWDRILGFGSIQIIGTGGTKLGQKLIETVAPIGDLRITMKFLLLDMAK